MQGGCGSSRSSRGARRQFTVCTRLLSPPRCRHSGSPQGSLACGWPGTWRAAGGPPLPAPQRSGSGGQTLQLRKKKTGIHTAGAAWHGGTGEGIGWWSRGGGGPPVRSGTGGQAPQEWKAAGGAGWGGQATQPSAAVGRRWLGGADIIAVQRLLAPLPGGTTQPRPAGTSCALTKAPPELAVGRRLLLWPHIHHLDLAADTGRWRAWHEQGGSSKEGHVSLAQVHCRIASDKLLPSMIQQAGGSAGR